LLAYHIDRYNRLKENEVINLMSDINIEPRVLKEIMDERYPDGLSFHGNTYYARQPQTREEIQDVFTENIFEYERRLNYAHMPSRFQSFFASETMKELRFWFKKLGNQESFAVWEVEFEHSDFVKLDASWLGTDMDKPSFLTSAYYAENYWTGKSSDHPQYELLIKSPIRVVKRVPYSELIVGE